jgi:hypothetical protein
VSTLAIAVLFASLVAKEILDPKRGALIASGVIVGIHLLFRQHPIPVVATAPLCFVSLWGAFVLVSRSPLALLPVAVMSVLAAIGMSEVSRDWVVTEFQLHDALTQKQIDEAQRRLEVRDAGTLEPGS